MTAKVTCRVRACTYGCTSASFSSRTSMCAMRNLLKTFCIRLISEPGVAESATTLKPFDLRVCVQMCVYECQLVCMHERVRLSMHEYLRICADECVCSHVSRIVYESHLPSVDSQPSVKPSCLCLCVCVYVCLLCA